MSFNQIFTSESVTEGHPDKIADQISDAILDAILEQDPTARVACETLVKTGMVFIGGEITTSAWVDVDDIARQVVKDIGYNSSDMGFDWSSCAVVTAIGKQSPDIAQGVNASQDDGRMGAGDQGMMFGYASRETDVLMPAPIAYAHRLVERLASLRKRGQLAWLRPDGKSQVTLVYENGQPVAVDTVVLSSQHSPEVRHQDIVEALMEEVVKPILPQDWLTSLTRFFINPTGRFVIGGPLGDCGLTGRKIIVDSYGGMARHGGGCFSGKDPSKVDRSAAYAARHVAKNIVAAGLADKCEIQLSYAIGVAEPTSIALETFGTARLSDSELVRLIQQHFDLTPQGIIDAHQLQRPIYRQTAAYGHFGRDGFPWERTDKAAILAEAL